jgi:hypothetical protein
MWSSIFINIIISTIIIFIIHSVWIYIKNTYSTKKTKDLVGSQIKTYKNIIEQLQTTQMNREISASSEISMEEDLEKWMKESLQTDFQNNNI